ncbi:MAG: ATPase [Rubricella sp.]
MTAHDQVSPPAVEAPRAPVKLEETGVERTVLRDILLKTIFRTGVETITQMARAAHVVPPVIDALIDIMRADSMIETLGNRGASAAAEMRYQLTDSGRARALDALAQSEYYGAFPVSLRSFADQAKRQSIRRAAITRDALEDASSHLVLKDGLIDQLGPAVNSGRSILLYGPPGNGKSALSQAIRDAIHDHVFIPRVMELDGQIVSVFDPIVHRALEQEESAASGLRRVVPYDSRFVRCRRPTVITGGELTLDMLDLNFNPTSRTYTAPLQLKATGGLFIVDDLGRQRESAQALMNRWIVPIEQRFDLLALQSGQKFTVPFDTLVIFSTNFAPKSLFDGAALRRIYYKIQIDGPSQRDFLKIFVRTAQDYGMKPDEDVIAYMLRDLYPKEGAPYASFHAPFLIDQMSSICIYEGAQPHMSRRLLDQAWSNLFVADAEDTL